MSIIIVSKILSNPWVWRLTGFVSSIVGFICYGLSPSFHGLFGHWNPLKIVIYSIVSSVSSILMLFVKILKWRHARSFLVKAQVGFIVLTLTSLYSFFEDRKQGQTEQEKGYGKAMNLTSTGAFALMALSLSRQLQVGFEVGVFNFLIGGFLVTVMKMNLKLAPVAALFCYLLVNIRSFSDFLQEIRGGTEHVAGGDGGNNNDSNDELTHHVGQNTDSSNEDDGVDIEHTSFISDWSDHII